MQIAIFGRVLKDRDLKFVKDFISLLVKRGNELWINESYLAQIKQKIADLPPIKAYDIKHGLQVEVEFLFSIGGDGTLLKTAQVVKDRGTHIMGINVGRLGFLTGVSKDKALAMLDQLNSREYDIDSRMMIRLQSSMPGFGEDNYALNEVAFMKKDSSSMILIHSYLNEVYLNTYWADGLIIATPTGSTGYSLSCGGPIIAPDSRSFVLTPVAAHNLNIRPLVISDEGTLSFEIDGRDEHFLCTLDSRYETINNKHRWTVSKAPFKLNLVRLKGSNFFKTIREKLNWGMDLRKWED